MRTREERSEFPPWRGAGALQVPDGVFYNIGRVAVRPSPGRGLSGESTAGLPPGRPSLLMLYPPTLSSNPNAFFLLLCPCPRRGGLSSLVTVLRRSVLPTDPRISARSGGARELDPFLSLRRFFPPFPRARVLPALRCSREVPCDGTGREYPAMYSARSLIGVAAVLRISKLGDVWRDGPARKDCWMLNVVNARGQNMFRRAYYLGIVKHRRGALGH